MKKLTILFSSMAMLFGVGLGVGAAVKGEAKVEKAEAASPTGTIYLDLHSTNWASKGESIYVHYWGGQNASTWPGVAMTKNDFGLYTATVSTDSTGLKFHVAKDWGGDCETGDLSFNSSNMLWTITKQQSPCTASSAAYSEKTIYVLDKCNSRLQVNHYAHVYNSSYGTTWPGVPMQVHSGRIYKATVPSTLTSVIWHNNEGNQTADLSIDSDCSVLEEDWNGTKWVKKESAEFIDGYMHFNDISVENVGSTSACAANYGAAKTAYNALSSNTIRKEVLSVNGVQARLSAWATANHDTLDTASGGTLGSRMVMPSLSNDFSSNATLATVIITVVSLAAVGGFFFLRKKKLSK